MKGRIIIRKLFITITFSIIIFITLSIYEYSKFGIVNIGGNILQTVCISIFMLLYFWAFKEKKEHKKN